jgi:peptidoglycan/LPS O-acetylase OafA/YrhL
MVSLESYPTREARILQVDVIRGLAILSVVFVHTLQYFNITTSNRFPRSLEYFISQGKYGVELFFIISGYLMAVRYQVGSTKLGSRYALKRFLRIYPLWLIFFLLAGVLCYVGEPDRMYSSSPAFNFRIVEGDNEYLSFAIVVILSLTFTLWISGTLWNSVLPGGWSIQAEIFSYVAFPILRRYSLRRLFLLMSILNVISLTSNHCIDLDIKLSEIASRGLEIWNRISLSSTLGFFFLGIVFFTASNQKNVNDPKHFLFDPKTLLCSAIFLELGF